MLTFLTFLTETMDETNTLSASLFQIPVQRILNTLKKLRKIKERGGGGTNVFKENAPLSALY